MARDDPKASWVELPCTPGESWVQTSLPVPVSPVLRARHHQHLAVDHDAVGVIALVLAALDAAEPEGQVVVAVAVHIAGGQHLPEIEVVVRQRGQPGGVLTDRWWRRASKPPGPPSTIWTTPAPSVPGMLMASSSRLSPSKFPSVRA